MGNPSLRREYLPGSIAYTEPDFEGYKRQQDLEYFDKYGYFPEQGRANQAAQQAAEAEWRQLVAEIEAQIGRIDSDALASKLREEFLGTMGGTDVPYDAGTINSLVSQGTDPIMGGAATGLSRLRESFASRGLGRTGGLGSLEQQLLQDAIARSSSEGAGIRGRYVGENFAARERARTGAAGLYGQQQGMRSDLVTMLANLRANRQFDPNAFPGGKPLGQGGYIPAGSTYSPPASIERRSVGQSAPRYKPAQYDRTGAWASMGYSR